MIFERIADWKRYDFGPSWAEVMAYCERGVHATATVTVAGCEIRHEPGVTRPVADCSYESHHRMADIQLLLSGREWIYVSDSNGLPLSSPFDPERDCGRHVRPSHHEARITLVPGRFVVLFPWDAHMALVAPDDVPGSIDKIIVKMPLASMRV